MLGYPLAYAIAFKAGRWKNLMLVAVIAPFFTSFLVRTLSWQYLLGDNEASWSRSCGRCTCSAPAATCWPRRSRWSPASPTTSCRSWCCRCTRRWRRSTPACSRPVRTCTPRRSATFRKVTLPLSMPGLVAGTLLTFIPAAGDYINAELLGNPQTRMIGNEIQDLFDAGDYPTAVVAVGRP